MRKKFMSKRSKSAVITSLFLGFTLMLGGCGGDAYSTYASAYNKVSAKGGINADIEATITLDDVEQEYEGNFKLDNTSNTLYYEMTCNGETTTQFSDGEYLYTERGGEKIKYDLNDKPDGEPQARDNAQGGEAPQFDAAEFLTEFSSFLEAGKIRELGLLNPLDKAAVTNVTVSGNQYTLEVSSTILKRFMNTMATNESGSGDAIEVTDLSNFTYVATIENGVVTGTHYSGEITIVVPGSLLASDDDEEYTIEFDIQITFRKPGTEVDVDIPDGDDYVLAQ
ncbi:MAG: hypothetical protein K5871_00460 [Lachnospiraceae bacterium]|nr:hypothetical protein [Lachnospiraceae bacterium]